MPYVTVATYEPAALVAAHESFRDLIDGGSGAGFVRLKTAGGTTLAQVPLNDPCGTVNGTTGQLTFSFSGLSPGATAGAVSFGEFCDSDGTPYLSLPADTGTSAVVGKIIINSLTLVSGAPVEILSAVIG